MNGQVQKISILPPQKGLEFPGGWGGGLRKKIPPMGEVWIFSGTAELKFSHQAHSLP